MTSLSRRLSRLSLVFLTGAVLLPGCDLAAGLQDVGSSLTNPDATLLDRPGRKLADGLFRQLLIDGSLDEGGHVIALREIEGEQELAIIPYLEDNPCYLKPAVTMDRLSSRVDVELPGILSVQRTSDENGRGDISFVNFECEEVFEGFTGSKLPQLSFPATLPRGLLGVTGAGELYLVEPGNKRTTYISSGASQPRSTVSHLWTIEEDQLVVRDSDLKVIDQIGNGVVSYVLTNRSPNTAAFMAKDGLSIWNQDEGVTHISDTACSPTAWGDDTLAYFDPCEERRLNVYIRGARVGVKQDYVRLVGPEGVADLYQELSPDWGSGVRESHVGFIVGEPGAAGGALHLARIPPEVEVEDDGMTITMETEVLLAEGASIRAGEIFLDWNGVSGELLEFDSLDGDIVGLVPVAPAVAQLPGASAFSPRGVLSDFDGVVGELRYHQRGETSGGTLITSEIIAEGVPIQPQVLEPETNRMAFVGDSADGISGTLYLGRDPDDDPTNIRALDNNVLLNTARFLEQPRGLAYLVRAPGDPEAQLRVWLIDSEITLTIHKNVHEYRTVPWPAPGILYAVPSGADQGMWFSKAR